MAAEQLVQAGQCVQVFDTMRSEPLLAVPLYILMAAILQRSGIGPRDIVFLRAIFRYLRQVGISYGLSTVVEALRREIERVNAPSAAEIVAFVQGHIGAKV